MESKLVLMLKAVYNTLWHVRNRMVKNRPSDLDKAQTEAYNALVDYLNKAVLTCFNMLPTSEKEKINADPRG